MAESINKESPQNKINVYQINRITHKNFFNDDKQHLLRLEARSKSVCVPDY